MFKFEVAAEGPDPLIVQFEPMGNEMVVNAGDYITIDWPAFTPGPTMLGTFACGPGRLEIREPHFLPGHGWARVWNSSGEEITE
jgi:hypothetical protein